MGPTLGAGQEAEIQIGDEEMVIRFPSIIVNCATMWLTKHD